MAYQTGINLSVTSLVTDSFTIAGGSGTPRNLTLSGGDVTMVGGGGNAGTFLFPAYSDTLAGLTSVQILTHTSFSATPVSITGALNITSTATTFNKHATNLQISDSGGTVLLSSTTGGTLSATLRNDAVRNRAQAIVGDAFSQIPSSFVVAGQPLIYDGVVGKLSLTTYVNSVNANVFSNIQIANSTMTGGAALVGIGNSTTSVSGSLSASFATHSLLLINGDFAVGGDFYPCGSFMVPTTTWTNPNTNFPVYNIFCTPNSFIWMQAIDPNGAAAQVYVGTRSYGMFNAVNGAAAPNSCGFNYLIINSIIVTAR